MDFDATSADTLRDPYAIYRELQREEPVHWSASMQTWVLTRHEHVREVLVDPRSSARHTVQQLGAGKSADMGIFGKVPSLPTTDPPVHTHLRRLVSKAFTPRSVAAMRGTAEAIVEGALSAAESMGRLDVSADLAGPMPSQIIAAMLGVPVEDWASFRLWSDDLFKGFKGAAATPEDVESASHAVRQLEKYFREIIRARHPDDDDLVARITFASDNGTTLSEDEIVATCIVLLVGGNETTTALIVNGLGALADRPEVVSRLRGDPQLAEPLVEELLRLWGPVHLIARKATQDVTFGGKVIRPGDHILLITAAANRDPAVFTDPDEIHLDRDAADHIAFGLGRHFCIGAPLARLEARIALSATLGRLPELLPAPGPAPAWTGPLTARRLDEVRLLMPPGPVRNAEGDAHRSTGPAARDRGPAGDALTQFPVL